MNERLYTIGTEVYVHGYVDEIRKDTVVISNDGGYFGTVESEIRTLKPESADDESYGDAISRSATLNEINKKVLCYTHEAREIVSNMLSVQLESRWIPVSERLPKQNGIYIVTLNNSTVDFCRFQFPKTWGWFSDKGWADNDEVTAWMPLPEPYKAESEE